MARIIFETTGNLGSAPNIEHRKKYSFAQLNVAVNHAKKDEDGEWETIGTTWINSVAFGKFLVDHIERLDLKKGDKVKIKGHMQTVTKEDEDGDEVDDIDWILTEVFAYPSENGNSKRDDDDDDDDDEDRPKKSKSSGKSKGKRRRLKFK